jgi:hypothetical protein
MMQALLFLSLVGAAIYGFLVVTEDALTDAKSKDGVAIKTQHDRSADERLSSWGSYLPSQSQTQNPQLATSQQSIATRSQERIDPSRNSERYPAQNRAGSSESVGSTSGRSIAAPVPAQVVAESTTEPLTTRPPVRKSSKRSRSARHGAVVATEDPWNGRWSRRVERRRGFGLFMFRPFPNGRY